MMGAGLWEPAMFMGTRRISEIQDNKQRIRQFTEKFEKLTNEDTMNNHIWQTI